MVMPSASMDAPDQGNRLREVKTQCHPDRIFDMVNLFNEKKRLLVGNMGCQSMLGMNKRMLDSGLSRHLLELVDTTAGTLRIGLTHIPIRPYVRRITGLPNGPTEIKADDSVPHFDGDDNMKRLFHELPSSTLGLPLSVCSETDDRNFSIKFMLAIIALYVAPLTSPNNQGYKNYFGPISKCEDMKSLNLCELAVKSLLDGIDRYRLGGCYTCAGCMDILHVMFIDFVSTESIHLPGGFPRIKLLTHRHFDLLHSTEFSVLNVAKDVKDTAYYHETDDTNSSTIEHHEHPGQGGVTPTHGHQSSITEKWEEETQEHEQKVNKYQAILAARLKAKYFSYKAFDGGKTFEAETIVDGKSIQSSRWPCTSSFTNPVIFFRDKNNYERRDSPSLIAD